MHDDGDCPQRTLLADMLLDAVRPSGNYSGFVNTDGKKTIQITADSIECWIRGQVKYLGKCRHLYGTSATLPGSPGSCRGTAEMIQPINLYYRLLQQETWQLVQYLLFLTLLVSVVLSRVKRIVSPPTKYKYLVPG